MSWYKKLTGRPKGYTWNLFLLNLAHQGLGINQWRSIEASGEKHFLQHILPKKKEAVIFDVGAYHGSYSKEALCSHPDARLFAFEPHPKSFSYLQQTAQALHFNAYPMGMGEEQATKLLYDYARKDGSAQASLYEEAFESYNIPTRAHTITVTTLDTFCKEKNIEHIDLLKVDAEGFEYEVLAGAQRMTGSLSVDIIQFELNHLSLISKKSIFDFKKLLPEYRFYRILYRGLIPIDWKQPMQALSEHQNIVAWSNLSPFSYEVEANRTILTANHVFH
jgi:FkbM family methyltransferase